MNDKEYEEAFYDGYVEAFMRIIDEQSTLKEQIKWVRRCNGDIHAGEALERNSRYRRWIEIYGLEIGLRRLPLTGGKR